MGFRFHKSIKLLPGIRLNLSKSGPSVSLGESGLSYNIGKKGTRTTVGLPGSGMSYSSSSSYENAAASPFKFGGLIWGVIIVVFAIISALAGK